MNVETSERESSDCEARGTARQSDAKSCNSGLRDLKNGGFTLVELMVVIAIIAAIVALVLPTLGRSKQSAMAVLCGKHLSEIYNSIELFKGDHKYYPKESGVRFFLEPWNRGSVERDPKYAKIYTCPGDENLMQQIEGDYGIIAEELEDFEHFDPMFTSYAGRNQKDFPIDFNKRASQLIVSDDDDGGMNHPNQVNVLYMDGSVDKVLLEEFEGEDFYVGDDAPLEIFEVLSNE